MDREIDLSRRYRKALCTAPNLGAALKAVAPESAGIPAATPESILPWFDDITACDLGPGVDIIHIELGGPAHSFELSAWRWADRIMLIDDGLIEPDSIRLIMRPGRVHHLPPTTAASSDAWLALCSFTPIALLATADLRAKWGIAREFTAILARHDAIFHGGFITPTGWTRPTKLVEVPHH